MKLTKETLKEMINEVLKENHESMLLESPETDKEVLTEEVVEVEAPDSVIEAMKKASEHPNKKIKFVRVPKFEEVPYPVVMEPNLVIEYYSR